MKWIARLAVVLLASAPLAFTAPSEGRRDELVAFSLKQAASRSRLSPGDDQVRRMAGITDVVGLACDKSTGDLIVVGKRDRQSGAIGIDDLAVALRAILLHKTWPLVSIDRTEETERTGQQLVRFAGGIERTRFGRDLLDADIVLKRLALGELAAGVWGLRSYFDLFREWWTANGSQERVHSRFWFTTGRSEVGYRDGGALLKAVDVAVETRVMAASRAGAEVQDLSAIRDVPGDAFAVALTSRLEDIGNDYPEVRRVRTLFQLVGLAAAIQKMPTEYPNVRSVSDYWIRDYAVAPEQTPEVFPLHKKSVSVQARNGNTWDLSLDGGIELKALILEIKDGSITAFRDMVLRSRPSQEALSWVLPVVADCLPRASTAVADEGECAVDLDVKSASGGLSCSIGRLARPADAPAPPPLVGRWPVGTATPSLPSIQFSSSLSPPRVSTRVGGVMLSGVAKFGDSPAKVDLADGNFSLIVNGENARLDPRVFQRFVTALWAVYFGRQDPGISIDPIYMDPETGRFSEKHLVRYIGRVVNTDLGRVMRDADYQMKKWSVGTDRADVPGFKSPDEIAGRSGIRYLSLSRFWLVPEDMKFKSGDNMLLFDRGRMTVNTEVIGSSIGEKQADPHNEEFARFFTDHYEEISRKHPIYQELFEYAKLAALAKYLKESGVPLFWFLMANRDLILTEDSPGTVDNLAKGSAYWQGLTIQGGVDLATKGQYVYDAPAVKALREGMAKADARPGRSTSLSYSEEQTVPAPFSFGLGPETYSVAPQHSLSAGKDRRGILYQTDFALRAEGYLVTQGLLDRLRAEMVRQRARRLLAPAVRGIPETELSARLPALVSSALQQSSQEMEPLSKRLESLRNREFKTEKECGKAWDDVAGVGEAAEWRPFFVKWAHYISNLELVRYFNPKLQERGEFGAGWRLLVPYRVKPVDRATVKFLNALVPRQMEVENLVSGQSERLTFSADRYAAAGYVPDKLESSQFIGLFLLSDASFRLVDKIGSEFQFDPAGFLTDLVLSEDHRLHIEYAGEVREAFEERPYSIEPADRERIGFLNAQIPKSMIVKDRIHNQSEVLSFSKEGEIAGYVPADADKSRYKILALLSDASFQLMHREGSVVSFTPSGEFERMELDAAKRIPSSIAMGNHKVAFRYTTDPDGRVVIASARLLRDTAPAAPTHMVRYEYDTEGRLTQAKRQATQEAAARYERPRDASQGAAAPGLSASIR